MTLSNNKRIAQNAVLLYGRMLVIMGISFFTLRELLFVLGEVNYGLSNVIAGVVTMFSFLSEMLAAAVSRYFNFELGKKDYVRLKQVFNMTQLIYVGLVFITLILSETLGLWFFYNKIVIPPERLEAAFWFFQFSVITFLIQILIIPYNSLIISHENMKIFTIISSFQALAKLIIVYLIHITAFDSLVFYGAMLGAIALISLLSYMIICYKLYPESHLKLYWEKKLFVELLSFSGWNLFGSISGLFTNIFINVLLNNYFGSIVNAARAIAMQVSVAVSSFMTSFLVATRPQITKYWSINEKEAMYLLTNRSARFGYFLMLFMSLPVLFETDFLLGVWLKKIPEYTIMFTRLVIIGILVDTVSNPLVTVALSTGKIALYQSVVGGVIWMNLPISWLFLRAGYPPQSTMYVSIVINIICLFLRLILVRRVSGLSIASFFKNVIWPSAIVSITSFILPLWIYNSMTQHWLRFVVLGFFSVISVSLSVLILGMTLDERKMIFGVVKRRLIFISSRNNN